MGRGHLTPILLALALGACRKDADAPAPKPFAVERDGVQVTGDVPVKFETSPAELGPPLPPPPVTGRVTTVESLTSPVFAPLAGRVVESKVKLGDTVQKGERLVLVRTTELPELKHSKQAAELAIRTKGAIVERLSKLVDARAASRGDLAVAAAELDEARLSATAANARLRALGVEVEGEDAYWLLAQRTGTVVQVDASPGREVGPGHDPPVATVADLSELLVVSDVPVRDADVLAPGMTADISTPGSAVAVVKATLERVSDVVDPDRQTVPVRLRVANAREGAGAAPPAAPGASAPAKGPAPAPSGSASAKAPDAAPFDGARPLRVLRPNAYVRVQFGRRIGADVVLVPSAAVVTEGSDAVVFVQTAPGKFKKRNVQLGRRNKEKSEVASGLQAGEKVVTTGALLLLNAIDIEG